MFRADIPEANVLCVMLHLVSVAARITPRGPCVDHPHIGRFCVPMTVPVFNALPGELPAYL
jgi:hypothetical protein